MVGGIIRTSRRSIFLQVTPLARLTEEYLVIVVPPRRHTDDEGFGCRIQASPGSSIPGRRFGRGLDHILAGMIAGASGVEAGKSQLRAVQGRRRSGGGHHRRPRGCRISGVSEFAQHIAGQMRALGVSAPAEARCDSELEGAGVSTSCWAIAVVFGAPGITRCSATNSSRPLRLA